MSASHLNLTATSLPPARAVSSIAEFYLVSRPVKNCLRECRGIIYRIINIVDNMIYIGLANGSFYERYKGGKWWQHTHNQLLKEDYHRLGKDAFVVDIFEINHTSEDLREIEALLIKTHNCLYPHGYNMVARSSVIRETTQKTRKKMSDSGKERMKKFPNPFAGKRHTEETRQIIREKNLGKKLSEEHKAKIRAHAPRGTNNHNFGKHPIVSEETKIKIRIAGRVRWAGVLQIDSQTKRVISEFKSLTDASSTMKISATCIGRACNSTYLKAAGFIWRYTDGSSPPFDYSPRLSKRARTVVQIDPLTKRVIAEFITIAAAAKDVNGHASNITNVCTGRTKTHCGFVWKYKV